jgi:hypothetical protein
MKKKDDFKLLRVKPSLHALVMRMGTIGETANDVVVRMLSPRYRKELRDATKDKPRRSLKAAPRG